MKINSIEKISGKYQVDNSYIHRIAPSVGKNISDKSSFESTEFSDVLEISGNVNSEEELKLKDELEKQEAEMKAAEAEMKNLEEQAKAAKEQANAVKEMFDVLIRCLKISGNIISGDKVPSSDHQYLMDNDSELYMLSVSARANKENPKKAEKVVENDEYNNAFSQRVMKLFRNENVMHEIDRAEFAKLMKKN